MHVIHARNVNEAFESGVQLLLDRGYAENTRVGTVLAHSTPVSTVYGRPSERVLTHSVRDANPFFHLMESVWMLAGRNDGGWLDAYVRDFSSRYAEDDGRIHGAYGYRWRRHFDMEGGGHQALPDQLLRIGEMLRTDPTTRRAVMVMWDPVADLGTDRRDIPCNTHVYFRARWVPNISAWELDTTVMCRSNDAVWGAYGANAVHMSIMAEIVAGLAGMIPGTYTQVSNNLHIYESAVKKLFPLRMEPDPYRHGHCVARPLVDSETHLKSDPGHARSLIADEARQIVKDAEAFCARRDSIMRVLQIRDVVESPWMREVVIPMEIAHRLWRDGLRDQAIRSLENVRASDWRLAGELWMSRRLKREFHL